MYRLTTITRPEMSSVVPPVTAGVQPEAGRHTLGEWGWLVPERCDWNQATNKLTADPVNVRTYVRLNILSARSSPATSAAIGSSRSWVHASNSDGKLERAGAAGARSQTVAHWTNEACASRNDGTTIMRRSGLIAGIRCIQQAARNDKHDKAQHKNEPSGKSVQRARLQRRQECAGRYSHPVCDDRHWDS